MSELVVAATTALCECLALKSHESFLVVTDTATAEIGSAFRDAGDALSADSLLMTMTPRRVSGIEPPAAVSAAMLEADVVVIPTLRSLSHTRARRDACKAGARIATLPGITREMMLRALNVDYKSIGQLSRRIAEILTGGARVELSTPAGTRLVFSIDGRAGFADTGILHNSGDFGNLPAGEAFLAPVEGLTEGELVIDGSFADLGLLQGGVLNVTIEHGVVVGVSGIGAEHLQRILDLGGEPARNVAELGIGTNPSARLSGSVLEDEKVLGTVHVALGDNLSMGGLVKAPSHLDGVLLKPTISVDGRPILAAGELVL